MAWWKRLSTDVVGADDRRYRGERNRIAHRKREMTERSSPTADLRPGSAGEHHLQTSFGTTERADRFYADQLLDHLNDRMIEFVGRQDMAFIATADAAGECDSTFRAGTPGFIQVIDERTVAYPEYRGNGVLASLGNISENPHVAILLIDFVSDLIGLHINGTAEIVGNTAGDSPVGRTPERWVLVHVEEAYIHCRKHIPRMVPAPRQRAWGTDNPLTKGGDFFAAKAERQEPATVAEPAREHPVTAESIA